MGKTAQAVVAADLINAQRILVICPASVRINWTREFVKFGTRSRITFPVLESSQVTTALQSTAHGGLVACSYDLATKSEINSKLRAWLASVNGLLVLDEVHFLKSVEAKRSHAVLGKGGLVHHAGPTWALSGTPAPNYLNETWPLLRCFGVWKDSYDAFVSRFCQTRTTPYGTVVCGNKNIPEYRTLIRPIILRRKKEEVMHDLPPVLFSDVTVEPGPVDYEIDFPEYFIVKDEPRFRADIAKQRATLESIVGLMGTGAAGLASLAPLMGDGGSASTLRRLIGLQKVKGVVDLVTDELNSGLDKIAIFAIHRAVIENLRVGLAKFGAVTLYGGTEPSRKQRNIDKFARDTRCRVFIGNIVAAGTGVDGLQRQCASVLLVEKYGVPGWMAQAIMRVHRAGQTRPVNVRSVRLAGDDTFDRIERVLFRKTKDLVATFD